MMLRRDMMADLRRLDQTANMARTQLLTLPFWRWRARAAVEDVLLRAEVAADRLRLDLYGGKATDAQGCPKEGLEGGRTIQDKGETAKGQEGGKE
jgi:hypothetical protein